MELNVARFFTLGNGKPLSPAGLRDRSGALLIMPLNTRTGSASAGSARDNSIRLTSAVGYRAGMAEWHDFRRRSITVLGAVTLLAFGPLAADALRVACIGDSITAGAGVANPSADSYPARLQSLLGAGYVVGNFGVSGRTLLKRGDYPYWQEPAYAQSRNFAPDIVLIALGTNDAKAENWRFGADFAGDYAELIRSYTTPNRQPRVLLVTPCPVFLDGAYGIDVTVLHREIAPAIRDLAMQLGHEVVDFHDRLQGHAEWFPDTLHPNTRGTAVMAAVAWSVVARAGAPGAAPRLEVGRLPSDRGNISWPADRAGWVLQSATPGNGFPWVWTVADQAAVSEGGRVGVTVGVGAAGKGWRLWWPAGD